MERFLLNTETSMMVTLCLSSRINSVIFLIRALSSCNVNLQQCCFNTGNNISTCMIITEAKLHTFLSFILSKYVTIIHSDVVDFLFYPVVQLL